MQSPNHIDTYDELLKKLKNTEKELNNLMSLSKLANQDNSSEESIQNVIDLVLETVGENGLAIRLYNEKTGEFILKASRGLPKEYEEKYKVIKPDKFLFNLLITKKVIYVQNTSDIPIPFMSHLFQELGLVSALGIPLISNGKIMGSIVIYSTRKGCLNEKNVSKYILLANQILIIIESFRLHDNLTRSYLKTIKDLLKLIEAKDSYTKAHAERVTNYCLVIGQEIGLDTKRLTNLIIAAMLHDIGKITLPERILCKPAKLTDEEFDIVKQHPAQGKQIIKLIGFDKEILDGIHYHHERIDGGGYPEGLKQEEIPLFARILAVADAFDAMTSSRPYRQGLLINHALLELVNYRGIQFDANIVEAFLRFWKKNNYCVNLYNKGYQLGTAVIN